MRLFLRFTLVLCVLVFAFHPASARQISRPPIISAGPSTDTPWLPDLQKFGERVAIPVSHRIDILILGDGYTSRSRFEKDVRNWYADFSAITPWRQTTGLFRVRGYWTPSEAHATAAKQSYYRLPASRASVGDVYDAETRRKIWEAIDTVQANLALNADNHLTHTVLVMLIRTTNNFKPSGKCRLIVAPDGKRRVRVAFGNFTHHEFGHAMARLDDEYIGADKSTRKKQPKRTSLFSVSNIAYSLDPDRLQWAHLLPGTPLNPDKDSVIGLLWIGGEVEFNAWHSEPYCMMNGGSRNWNRDKTARTGWWRSTGRFCFWCEEMIVARLWHRAGLFGEEKDGYLLWKRWATEWRPAYHRTFDVPSRLVKRNALYAKNRLADAKLYVAPKKPAQSDSGEEEKPDSENTSEPLEDTPAPDDKPEEP